MSASSTPVARWGSTARVSPKSPTSPKAKGASSASSSPLRRVSGSSHCGSVQSSSMLSLSELLQQLAPDLEPLTTARLQEYKIKHVMDLAYLDKKDLKELGFNMLERSRILRWSSEYFPIQSVPAMTTCQEQDEEEGAAESARPESSSMTPSGMPQRFSSTGAFSPTDMSAVADSGGSADRFRSDFSDLEDLFDDDVDSAQLIFLDEVEERASFWCNLVIGSGAAISRQMGSELKDVRENMLEELFDISPERVREVFKTIDTNDDGSIDPAEFCNGLQRCGVQGLPENRRMDLINEVSQKRGCLTCVEFETILTRLKLAQLLAGPICEEPIDMTVMDYNALHSSEPKHMSTRELKSFFFGHRPRPQAKDEPGSIRWVHLSGLIGSASASNINLTLLLALTVKYQLHPLCVEDVIEQCLTKLDRYSAHYFAAIEQLHVLSGADGKSPVVVCSRHTTIFCAGAPHFDTVITIVQPDKSFGKDWPDAHLQPSSPDSCHQADIAWVTKLRKRLKSVRSRVRERRADFLMFVVVDLSTDDMVSVTQAFLSRLRNLEDTLRKEGAFVETGWVFEVSCVSLQLYVVSRRLRSMQRLLRKWKEDVDVSPGLSGYLQDVLDHAEEASDDTAHLIEKCGVLTSAYERAVDKGQELDSQHSHEKANMQDERQNKMLFVLTGATFMFSPLHFMCAVEGMNFVNDAGKPTMPELLWPHGYTIFWICAVAYMSAATAFSLFGWRRVMGNIDKDLVMRFPHLADDPGSTSKKCAAPARNTTGMISSPRDADQYHSPPYSPESPPSLTGFMHSAGVACALRRVPSGGALSSRSPSPSPKNGVSWGSASVPLIRQGDLWSQQ